MVLNNVQSATILTIVASWTQAILETENVRYAGYCSLGLCTLQTHTLMYGYQPHLVGPCSNYYCVSKQAQMVQTVGKRACRQAKTHSTPAIADMNKVARGVGWK